MARRTITDRVPCAEKGCPEVSWREFDTQRERAADWKYRQSHPYRCTRHSQPDEVLGEGNPERVHVLVASKVHYSGGGYLDGLYWLPEGSEKGGSGFTYGPGFKAFAKDFPEGTRLVVMARIELPSDDSSESTAHD